MRHSSPALSSVVVGKTVADSSLIIADVLALVVEKGSFASWLGVVMLGISPLGGGKLSLAVRSVAELFFHLRCTLYTFRCFFLGNL